MTRLARRLLAGILAASIVALSPGLEAPRLFAQVIGRATPASVEVRPVSALPGAAPGAAPGALPGAAPALMTAPSLTAPSAFSAAPVVPAAAAASPAAAAPSPAAAVSAAAQAVAPHLEALAQPQTSDSGAAAAGQGIENVLTGARSAGTGDVAAGVTAGGWSSGAPALSLSLAASAPSEPSKPGVPAAAAPAEGKVVDSAASYGFHRFLLKTVAAVTGAVYSLPIAGPALTKAQIAKAADTRVVLSDYDDTLAGYNQVLPEDMVDAVRKIRAAGKDFAVISDRGDEKRAHQLTVFESLASLPVELRAGMYVAANSGGRVYRYDAQGEPVRVFEVPALDEASKAKVAEAAEAVKSRLHEVGTEMHVPSATNNNPSESWGTYGYALMLKVGSSKESVVKAGEMLQDELNKRGLNVEVSPRFAKDPANPPYINFSIVTKAPAAEFIAKALGARAEDVVILGDNHYAPHRAKKDSWLTRLGFKAAGREIPAVGNRTDANMEKGVPGALTLSVGGTGDPRASNLFVLSGKGPSMTREVLLSVASKKRGDSGPRHELRALEVAGVVALLAGAAGAYFFLIHGMAGWIAEGERLIQQGARDADGLFFGGMLAMAGMLGASSYQSRLLANPAETYGEARKKAVEIAAARGASADQVRFVEATASMPVSNGEHWKYSFEVPGKNGGKSLVYVDFSSFLGGRPEARASVYEGAQAASDRLAAALEPYLVNMGSKVEPQHALDAVRAKIPSFGGGASVSLQYRREPVSGDADLWYKFYDDKGAVASVNARTGEVRADSVPAAKASKSDSDPRYDGFFREMAIGFGILGLIMAAVWAFMTYVSGHAPAAVDPNAVPGFNGTWEGLFGGTLGLGMGKLFRRKAKTSKPAKPEDAWTLAQSVSPASPIDGFSTFVFDEGVRAAGGLAGAAGYRADNLRFASAKLSPRAWGEDWTFAFFSPRESLTKGPRRYEVTVRRTMVMETLVDAIKSEDLGPSSLPPTYPVSLFGETVQIDPMTVVAKAGDRARTLEAVARWSDDGARAKIDYVVRGFDGKELKAVDATTGVEKVPQPWAWVKPTLITLGLLAATAAVYGVIIYGLSHVGVSAGSTQVPEGWQGPIPNNMDIGALFGGTLAAGAAGRGLRGKKAKPTMTDEQVQAAARGVASYKGRPWSATEYNMAYSNTLQSLKKGGATEAQLALFEKLCAEAPVRGGGFNPWSGD